MTKVVSLITPVLTSLVWRTGNAGIKKLHECAIMSGYTMKVQATNGDIVKE